MGSAPLKVFKAKENENISVAVFENSKGYALTVTKRYQSKGWKDTKNYFPNEIEGLVEILVEAHAFVMTLPEKEVPRKVPEITDMVPMPDVSTSDDDGFVY